MLNGLPDLLDEFDARPWIIRPTASWDATRRRLVVSVAYEGEDVEHFRGAASDEVWDCVLACLDFSSDEIQFDVDKSAVVDSA